MKVAKLPTKAQHEKYIQWVIENTKSTKDLFIGNVILDDAECFTAVCWNDGLDYIGFEFIEMNMDFID